MKILDNNRKRWNERYRLIEETLSTVKGVTLPMRLQAEDYVGSSIQFLLKDMTEEQIKNVIKKCLDRGVELKWFGAPEPAGYTSRHDSWRYIESQALPVTDHVLSKMLDMRIPLTFSLDDCRLIGEIIGDCVSEVIMAQ